MLDKKKGYTKITNEKPKKKQARRPRLTLEIRNIQGGERKKNNDEKPFRKEATL